MNKLLMVGMMAASAAMLAGCATTHARESSLDMAAKTAALEPQDVRRTASELVEKMITDPDVLDLIDKAGGNRIVLDVVEIQNHSTMHIDTKMVTDSMRIRLRKTRKFRFMDHTTAATDLKFMNDQAMNGMTDPTKAVQMGRQSAAQLYLSGDLREMRNQTNGVTDRYFVFSLNLKDLSSGEIIWSDDKQIRKEQDRSVMGF